MDGSAKTHEENLLDRSRTRDEESPRSAMDAFLRRKMGWIPARIALAVMAWFGFINLYMVRVNLSVAIVAMVKRTNANGTISACSPLPVTSGSVVLGDANDTTSWTTTEEFNQLSATEEEHPEEGEMEWDEATQGLILGSFFYGYALTQIIGGRMAELYGTKFVFGFCILGGGICAILSPAMARLHYGAFITLRVIQGLIQGVSWPSMHACISRWIPPIERPRYVAVVYLAVSLSSAVTMPLVGVIIASHGWAAQFYVMGALSLVWSCFWFSLMYNTPEEHPRISPEELGFIQKALKESGTKKSSSKRIPWRQIFTSLPMWAILSYTTGNCWGIGLFFAQLPTYMKNVLGFSIRSNGALSALPFLCRYVGAIACSTFGSWLLSRGYLSIRATRRIFSVIAMWGPATLILIVSFVGCNRTLTVVLFCLALFCNGATTTSGLVNHTDIAPNFAGTLFGIDNTIGSIVSFLVPTVTGVMTNGQQTLEAWQRVFWICVPMYFITEVFFLLFVSGDVQPWNDIDHVKANGKTIASDSKDESEQVALQAGSKDSKDAPQDGSQNNKVTMQGVSEVTALRLC